MFFMYAKLVQQWDGVGEADTFRPFITTPALFVQGIKSLITFQDANHYGILIF